MTSVFENYPNLPGFVSEFKDGGLQVRALPATPATDSILLLGTAVDGPIGEPVAVDSETVELVFGGSVLPNGLPNGSNLVKAFHEAAEAGCRDIRLMRVTGKKAVALLKGSTVERIVETPVSDRVGVASGNIATVLKLNQITIDTTSVVVNANSATLPVSAYTVAQGTEPSTNATVTVKADTVSAGTHLYVSYKYTDADTVVRDVVENGFVEEDGSVTYYVAEGADMSFTLSQEATPATVRVYANGVELPLDAHTLGVNHTDLTIKKGYARRGEELEVTYIHEDIMSEETQVKLESVFGGSVYNQGQLIIENMTDGGGATIGKRIKIVKPDAKKGQVTESPLEYTSIDYPSLGLLVAAINQDTNNSLYRASIKKTHEQFETKGLSIGTPFAGGDDGLSVTKQDMFNILGGKRDSSGLLVEQGVYHLLENYTVDFIIPLGVYADDVLPGKYDNFGYQLALACAVISHRNNTTTGIIATSSPDEAGLAAVQAHVTKLLAAKPQYFMRDRSGNVLKDSTGAAIDLGRFVQVVAGPDLVVANAFTGAYADNTGAGYTGFVTGLRPQSSPSNKVLPFARGLRYNYSNSQLDALTAAGYVTFRYKNNATQVAVTDAPTAAGVKSDYRRLTTIRVVKEVINELRSVCDPYLGESNTIVQRNAMAAAISKRLDLLQKAGVILGAEFRIIADAQMQLVGDAQLELTIYPPQELRKITTVVGLRPSTGA